MQFHIEMKWKMIYCVGSGFCPPECMNVNLGRFPMLLELGFARIKCLESTNGKTTPEH